jgi:hypothetical protein
LRPKAKRPAAGEGYGASVPVLLPRLRKQRILLYSLFTAAFAR